MDYLKFDKVLRKQLRKDSSIFTSVTVTEGDNPDNEITIVAGSFAKRGQKFIRDHVEGEVAKAISFAMGFRGHLVVVITDSKITFRVKEGRDTKTFEGSI